MHACDTTLAKIIPGKFEVETECRSYNPHHLCLIVQEFLKSFLNKRQLINTNIFSLWANAWMD